MNALLDKPVLAVRLALGAAAAVLAGFGLVLLFAPTRCTVGLALAGDGATFTDVLADACGGEPARAAIWLDFVFIAGYAAGLGIICWIGSRLVYTGAAGNALHFARRAVTVAAVADVLQNVLTLIAIDATSTRAALAPWVEAAALVTYVTVSIAVAGAVVVVVALVGRLWASRGEVQQVAARPGTPAGTGEPADPGSVWAQNYRVPPPDSPSAEPLTGICLSGGGIRSATFAMGAMQVFGQRRLLERADYLSVVSGGSYLGGAQQMLRHRSTVEPTQAEVPLHEVFGPGTPEEDRARRHGKYIADGTAEWLVAIGVVARNVLLGLALIYAALVLGARALGAAYAMAGSWAEQVFAPLPDGAGWRWPDFSTGSWLALAVPFAAAAAAWVLSGLPKEPPKPLVVEARTWDVRTVLGRWAAVLSLITFAVAAGVFLGPVLVRLSQWASNRGGDITLPELAPVIGVVTIGTTVWNMVTKSSNQSGGAPGASVVQRIGKKASFGSRALLSAAVVSALFLLALAAFAGALDRAVGWYLADRPGVDWWFLVALGVLLLVGLFFDQTRMSLHVFYKRRLAGTFAVERLSPTRAEAIDYAIPTTLSEYGRPPQGPQGGPELLVCASANVSGAGLAPPGRRVTPLVFSWRYIGGPRLGYVDTADYERIVKNTTYEHDTTLMAAMAMSGAAFASAMGRMSTPFDILLSLSNARLGAWLPNPAYLLARSTEDGQPPFAAAARPAPLERLRTRLPKVRRIGYWAREIFGVYNPTDRFVYVSDGGHYENLGLVELLRRRCETVYCVDASGDSMASTLAQAATLAWEELGIRVSVEGLELAPQSAVDGTGVNANLRQLQKRLASSAVVVGKLHYPEVDGLPAVEGRLVVGKAVLTEGLEFPLQVHAMKSAKFPGDTTADQWFDANQFNAYLALGRVVGEAMVERGSRPTSLGADTTEPAPPPAPYRLPTAVLAKPVVEERP